MAKTHLGGWTAFRFTQSRHNSCIYKPLAGQYTDPLADLLTDFSQQQIVDSPQKRALVDTPSALPSIAKAGNLNNRF